MPDPLLDEELIPLDPDGSNTDRDTDRKIANEITGGNYDGYGSVNDDIEYVYDGNNYISNDNIPFKDFEKTSGINLSRGAANKKPLIDIIDEVEEKLDKSKYLALGTLFLIIGYFF